MPKFSLKTLLIFACASGIALFTLAQPTISTTILLMLVTATSLMVLALNGYRSRRSFPLVVAFSVFCYLVIADGGVLPRLERYLPTEWLLNRCSSEQTVVDSGRKRSDSLTKWMSRLCLEQKHKDLNALSSVCCQPTIDSKNATDAASIHFDTSIVLPAFALTNSTTVKISTKRDGPENRAFFITGHCLVAIAIVAVAMIKSPYKTKTTRNDEE